MIGYANLQQTFPNYNNTNYNMNNSMSNYNNYNNYNNNLYNNNYNNYNTSNYNTSVYPTTNNNYNTSVYPTSNNITNIYNNYYGIQNMGTPSYGAQQQVMFPQMQQQVMFPQAQQQTMYPQMQQQVMFPQVQQQDNSANMMQQMLGMLLPLLMQLLGSGTNATNGTTTVDQTEISVDDKGVWGDPHFETTGKNGEKVKFDQKGKVGDTYNVFSGDGYELDAKYDKWDTGYAIMGTATMKAGADTIQVTKDGKVTINDNVIKDGSSIKLNDGTSVKVEGKNAIVTTRDGDSKINITNGGGYLNVDPEGKFSNLNGILGTAIDQSKALTEEECEKFNVTAKA